MCLLNVCLSHVARPNAERDVARNVNCFAATMRRQSLRETGRPQAPPAPDLCFRTCVVRDAPQVSEAYNITVHPPAQGARGSERAKNAIAGQGWAPLAPRPSGESTLGRELWRDSLRVLAERCPGFDGEPIALLTNSRHSGQRARGGVWRGSRSPSEPNQGMRILGKSRPPKLVNKLSLLCKGASRGLDEGQANAVCD